MVDPVTAIAGGGALLSGIGGLFAGNKASKDAKKIAREAFEMQMNAFSPVTATGPGGAGITFQTGEADGPRGGTSITGVDVSAGNLDPIQQLLAQAGQQFDFGQGQLNNAQLAGLDLGGAGAGAFDPSTLQALLGMTGDVTGQTFGGFQDAAQNPFLGGLAQSLGLQGGDVLGGIGNFQQAFDTSLGRMREAAQPFEDRAFNQLQQRQFSTGQRGTSGGGLQTEAFARGLGQADLQRQLAAGGEARAQQASDLGIGQGLLGAGSGLQSLQDQLLQSAFGRFGESANLASGLTGNIAGLAQQQQQFGSNLFNLGTASQLFPQQFQAGNLANIQSLLGATGAIQNQAINPAQLALSFMTNQANTRIGAGSTLQNQIGNLTGPTNFLASGLGDLSQALGSGGAVQNLFGNIFGGGGSQPKIGSEAAAAVAAGVS